MGIQKTSWERANGPSVVPGNRDVWHKNFTLPDTRKISAIIIRHDPVDFEALIIYGLHPAGNPGKRFVNLFSAEEWVENSIAQT